MSPLIFEYQDHLYMRTEWFSGDIKPVHIGVYDRHYNGPNDPPGPNYCYWDGTDWYVPFDTPSEAEGAKQFPWLKSAMPKLRWRGLTKPVMERLIPVPSVYSFAGVSA